MDISDKSGYPIVEWATALDIPLKQSEEVVSIDLISDLPDDPADLRTLLLEESSDKEHWLTIAAAYCNQNKMNEGIRLINMALEVFQNVEGASLHTFLTWAHLKLAKEEAKDNESKNKALEQAELHLKDAIGVDPTWVGNMLATIDLYYQKGLYDKALETADLFIKSITAEDRRNGRTTKINCYFILLKAKLLYQKKNYLASLRLFQELLVLNPVLCPDPRIGIGLCFWQLKDYKMAITSWTRANELNPKDKNAEILVLLGKFHNSLANSENDIQFKESYSKALQDLNVIYNTNKQNPVLLTLLQCYFYFQGNYQKVCDIYDQHIKEVASITTNAVLSESEFWTALAHYALDDYRKAFTLFQESLRKNEDNLSAKFGLGQTQIKNNLLEEGILTFENLYKTHESIQELNYILGLLYAGKVLKMSEPLSSAKVISFTNKAIQFLEKYIKLTISKKNQMIVPKAYLVLSQLYELQNKYKQSLEYLIKCMETSEFVERNSTPLKVLNNIGCFYFVLGEHSKALEYFKAAQDKIENSSDAVTITLDFNIARASESSTDNMSEDLYSTIFEKHPNFVHLNVRRLYIKLLKSKTISDDIKNEVDKLMSENSSDLEVRSFYSWFMKHSLNVSKFDDEAGHRKFIDLENENNKETLVKYDSHDSYALISLGNFYLLLAKENKHVAEKSKQYYLKGIQLFQKALNVDPFNIFAAQGIAIVFAESGRLGPALEILRKIRDSLDNEDVHLNLSHCLLEMREYAKAIEGYEFTLKKFDKSTRKAKIYNLLGKAWYLRGHKSRPLFCYKKALENAKTALDLESASSSSTAANSSKIAGYKFNVALLHFEIAEIVRRASVKERTVEDIKDSLIGLKAGLKMLVDLKEKSFKFIIKDELEQRIQLGESTMQSALERSLKEQEQYATEQLAKLEEARKILEENVAREKEKEEEEKELQRIKLEKQKEEFKKLQEEARILIQEREASIVDEPDEKDMDRDSAFEDDAEQTAPKKAKKRKNSKNEGQRKRKRVNKKQAASNETEALEDEDENVKGPTNRKSKKSKLSNEFIDSDDDSETADGEDVKDEDDEVEKTKVADASDANNDGDGKDGGDAKDDVDGNDDGLF